MAIRNFWINADIEGRKTNLAGGPGRKDGGMIINIYQRSDGQITHPISIYCTATDGKLVTQVYENGEVVSTVVTDR